MVLDHKSRYCGGSGPSLPRFFYRALGLAPPLLTDSRQILLDLDYSRCLLLDLLFFSRALFGASSVRLALLQMVPLSVC